MNHWGISSQIKWNEPKMKKIYTTYVLGPDGRVFDLRFTSFPIREGVKCKKTKKWKVKPYFPTNAYTGPTEK